MLNVRKCAVRQTVKSINMSTKRRQKSIKSESGSGSLSSKSQSRQSPQAPGSSNTGGTTSTSNEGCLKCGKDDDHSHLLLCEACNDEYHTHCLDPPLDYVPEGDFFCDKCKPLKAFCRNDNLDAMVAALPPAFTQRFGEIVWAQGGAGFGWWPSCIYDPRLTVGGARKLALKNIGKKHLVYFFGCHDAPFTVLSDNKCLAWEEGLMEEYDLGKAAKSIGKTRTLMFEWALQQAIAENEKPIEYRLDWNHEEDATVTSAGKPQVQRPISVSKPRATGISGKRTPPIGNGNSKNGNSKKKAKKEKLEVSHKENKSDHANISSSSSSGNLIPVKTLSPSSTNVVLPTRRSHRDRKPSRSLQDASEDGTISSPPATPTMPESLAGEKSTPKGSNPIKIRIPKSSSPAKSPHMGNMEVFCKICRNDEVLTSADDDSLAFTSNTNVGFISLPSSSSSTFSDARSAMVRDLDEDSLPSKWKFFVPYLGPMSMKQEVKYGSMLLFLKNATNGEQFGDGTRTSPLRVFIYAC